MVIYLAKFLPSLVTLSEPLRQLTRQDTTWVWDSAQQQAFVNVKTAVSTTPVLQYYDPQEPVEQQVDASQKGLRAALLHNGQPVSYAPRCITKMECNWAHIKKEALTIFFGCNRFHHYLCNRTNIVVHTNHQLLEIIFKKPLLSTPKCLQYIHLKLQRITFKYNKGKELYLADTMSRAQEQEDLKQVHDSAQEVILQLQNISMHQHLNVTHTTIGHIQQCIIADGGLQVLATTIKKGWPERKLDVPEREKEYWCCRDELSVYDGTIFRGEHLVVPQEMRADMLRKANASHQDYYSDYWEIDALPSTDSSAIIKVMNVQFARHGIPTTLITDNATSFTRAEFQAFSRPWDIQHSTSSPYHPQGNGKAEASVKIGKNIMNKCLQTKSDPWLALLEWRNIPTSAFRTSPVQRLISRRTRTQMPT
ncbi:hypothetical protein PR048_005617 [Dryococelus australis]|uniref:Integrase catalytic domain-containing protein n=1 Tax=Dryococelus australis TaxID=614101 RepID=A0ABQ9I8R4_9NEOP|nr:hypothetical protein PR048_005617 [Dryococelus australis]